MHHPQEAGLCPDDQAQFSYECRPYNEAVMHSIGFRLPVIPRPASWNHLPGKERSNVPRSLVCYERDEDFPAVKGDP
ncbi:MAG TPA: hypothetical protein VF393_00730 [archaeon]